MLNPKERTRPETCLSDLQLDRLRVGELDDATGAAARRHVEECSSCRERFDALQADAAAFSEEAPPWTDLIHESEQAPKPGRRSWLRVVAGIGSVAAAAALMLVIWPDRDDSDVGRSSPRSGSPISPDPSQATRTKGGPRLGFVVRRDGRMFEGQPGQELQEGDALRFHYSSQSDAHLAVLSVDGSGAINVYYPRGPVTAPVSATPEQDLDNSVILDDVLGQETIFGVFCQQAQTVENLTAAIEADPSAPTFPDGCQQERLTVHKRQARP